MEKQAIVDWAFQTYAELVYRQVAECFAEFGIGVIVLKGPHLANTVYGVPWMRPYSDLDLLVRKRDFGTAVKVLLGQGFRRVVFARRRPVSLAWYYNWGFEAECGVKVELHRDLVGYGRYRLPLEEFFDRAEDFRFGCSPAKGLCPEDLLLSLAVHAAGDRFLEMKTKHIQDVAMVTQSRRVCWDELVARANAAGCRTALFLLLEAAVHQFGAGVPPDVRGSLRPSRGRRAILGYFLRPRNSPPNRPSRRLNPAARVALGFLLLDRWRDWPVVAFRFGIARLGDIVTSWLRAARKCSWKDGGAATRGGVSRD